jgi:hypothetical protein
MLFTYSYFFQLYSLFLSAAASPLMQDTTAKAWLAALEKGISAMAK